MVLFYRGGDLCVDKFIDLDFQSDTDNRKFTFSWKDSKQDITMDSTIEVKYVVTYDTAKKVVWMRKFIFELGVVLAVELPIPLFCDNNMTIR